MQKNNLLLRTLIEPDLPENISWWPQTIGWKIIIAALVIYFALSLIKKLRIYRLNRYRRQALTTLHNMVLGDATLVLQHLNSILKQVACHSYPYSNVAIFTDQKWLDFLYKSSGDDSWLSPLAFRWQSALYQPVQESQWNRIELAELHQLSCQWIANHRRGSNG